jgi:CBS domain-containing protein
LRKFMVIAIPLLSLLIFVGIMLSGDFLKKPLGNDDDIPGSIDELIQTVQLGKMGRSGQLKSKSSVAKWKRIVDRVQFSSERDEINFFSMSLARLEGAILVKDKVNAVMELKEAYEHWDQLGQ